MTASAPALAPAPGPTSSQPAASTHAWPEALATGLALTPLLAKLVVLAVWAAGPRTPIDVDGDDAALELYTLYAARGEQWLGPYSRYGWNHPGPLYFYLQAPIYELLGRHALALHVGALLLNLAAAVATLGLARRWGGARLLYPTAAALAVYAPYFGAARLDHPWNPFVTLIPFGLFLFLTAGVAATRLWALPALATVGSFLVQTHVGYAPIVLLLGGAATAAGLSRRRALGPAALALGITLALWASPLYERANLALMARFLAAGSEPAVGLTGGLVGLAQYLNAAPAFVAGGMRPISPAWAPGPAQLGLVALQSVLLGFGWDQWRLRRSPLAPLCWLGLLGIPAAAAVLASVRGPLYYYLALWVSVLGLVGWAAVAAALWPRGHLGERAGAVLALGLVAWAAAVGVRQVVSAGLPVRAPASEQVAVVARAAAAEPLERPLLRIGGPEQWQALAGLVLRMEKDGRSFAVDRPWSDTFGRRHAPTGAEDGVLLLEAPGATPAGYRSIADSGTVRLLVTSRP